METFKEICARIAMALWWVLCAVGHVLAFTLSILSTCLLFFFVGFSAGRLMNDD